MKVKIFSFITALSIGFSSLIFPFFSVNVLAETGQQAVVPWIPIFEFIAESLGAWAIGKGADHAVDQLTGSGRKMTDDEYNATSKDWDACVSYMKSQGCTDSDIENLQAQIQGGDLDLSSKVGQAMQNYFAQQGSNLVGAWDVFNNEDTSYYPSKGSFISVENAVSFINTWHNTYYPEFTGHRPQLTVDMLNAYLGTKKIIGLLSGPENSNPQVVYVYCEDSLINGKVDLHSCIGCSLVAASISLYWSSSYEFVYDSYYWFSGYEIDDHNNLNVKKASSINIAKSHSMPSRISSNGGNIPHYFYNTIDNDDSSKNTYNNTPASIDWSKIFDHDDDKNPTFKKIDGYTPPEPKIKEDGSNYDEVVKQLKEANCKLAKILGWLEDFDYDNNGKIKDHRLSPIEPNTPLFNFKLSEKFPFSLPWDMLAILSILKAAPVAPKYEFPIMMPDESGKVKSIKLSDDRIGVIQGDKIVLDFTSQDWQDTAKILRWGELVLFICGLCVVFWKYGK